MPGYKLKGLTAADRQEWEKENINSLNKLGYDKLDDTHKDALFKKIAFKSRFKNDPNFNELNALPQDQKDSLLLNKLSMEQSQFGEMGQQKSLSDSLDKNDRIDIDTLNKNLGYDPTEIPKISNDIYNTLSKDPFTANKLLKAFDTEARQISPYYNKYINTDYLPLNRDDKLRILSDYRADIDKLGKDKADNNLRGKLKTMVSENQPFLDKLNNGLKGATASLAGGLITTYGFFNSLVNSAVGESSERGVLADAIDNKITRLGNDITKYSTVFGLDEARKDRMDTAEVITTQQEDEGGILDNLLSINTIPNLIKQQGFTIASMLLSAGLTKLGDLTVGGIRALAVSAATEQGLLTLDRVNKGLQILNKVQEASNAFIVPSITGTIEGVQNALDSKLQYLEDGEQRIAMQQEKDINEEFNRRISNPEQLKKEGYNPSDKASMTRLYKDIYDAYAPNFKKMSDHLNDNAIAVSKTSLGINSLINGFLGTTVKAGIQSEAVQESLKKFKLGRLFQEDAERIIINEGKAVPKKSIIKRSLKVLQEPLGEGLEEYTQDITDDLSRAAGDNNMTNFIKNGFIDPNTPFDDVLAALIAAGQSAVSKQSILSGIYGGLASAMGTPTINTRMNVGGRYQGESKVHFLERNSPVVYRNPIYEAIRDQMSQHKDDVSDAKTINLWMQDPENKVKFDGVTGTINWMNALDEAGNENDEFAFRNSKLGKTVSDMMVLNKIKNTEYAKSLLEHLTTNANLNADKKKAQEAVSEFRANPENKDSQLTDEEIVTKIQDNASKMLDIIDKIDKYGNSIESQVGNSANNDVKQALIYGKIALEDRIKRGNQLKEDLSKVEVTSTVPSSSLSEDQKKTLVYNGSLNKIKKNIESVNSQIASLEEDLKKLKGRKNQNKVSKDIIEKKEDKLSALKKNKKALESSSELLADNESSILNEQEIMALPVEQRAFMFNSENTFYSAEQQKILDNLKTQGTSVYDNFNDKVVDAGRIEISKRMFQKQYNEVLSNPYILNVYTNKLRQEKHDILIRKKYEYLNDIKDYGEFIKELNSLTINQDEISILQSVLKDNNNFKQFQTTQVKLNKVVSSFKNNEAYNNLSNNEKGTFITALKYLSSKNEDITDIDRAISLLSSYDEQNQEENSSDTEFMKYVRNTNEKLPVQYRFHPESTERLAKIYKEIIGQYNSNKEEVSKISTPATTKPSEKPVIFDATEEKKENLEEKPKEESKEELKEESKEEAQTKPKRKSFLDGATKEAAEAANKALSQDEEEEIPKTPVPSDKSEDKSPTPEETPKNNEDTKNTEDKDTTPEEVRKKINNAILYVQTSSDNPVITDAIRTEASEVLSNLAESEYPTFESFVQAAFKKSDTIENPLVSSLIKTALQHVDNTSVEDSPIEKPHRSLFDMSDGNGNDIRDDAQVSLSKIMFIAGKYLNKLYKSYKIDDYLRSGKLTFDKKIKFITNTSLETHVKEEMEAQGYTYNRETMLPVMVIVEDEDGPVTVGDKKYQPLGFLPSTGYKSKGSFNAGKIRERALIQESGTILSFKDGKEIVTSAHVSADPLSSSSSVNMPVLNILQNDLQEGENLEDSIKNFLKKVFKLTNNGRIRISYMIHNMKDKYVEAEIFKTPVLKTLINGVLMSEYLKNADTSQIINANFLTIKYAHTISKFMSTNPFDDSDIITSSGGELKTSQDVSELTKKLESLLSDNVRLKNGYSYKLTPLSDGGKIVYTLNVKYNDVLTPVGVLYNGINNNDIAQILKNVILNDFVTWNINYNDFALADRKATTEKEKIIKEIATKNITNAVTQGLLYSSRETFKYHIKDVYFESPNFDNYETPPQSSVANPDNASIEKPKTPDNLPKGKSILEKVKDSLDIIFDISKKLVKSDDNTYTFGQISYIEAGTKNSLLEETVKKAIEGEDNEFTPIINDVINNSDVIDKNIILIGSLNGINKAFEIPMIATDSDGNVSVYLTKKDGISQEEETNDIISIMSLKYGVSVSKVTYLELKSGDIQEGGEISTNPEGNTKENKPETKTVETKEKPKEGVNLITGLSMEGFDDMFNTPTESTKQSTGTLSYESLSEEVKNNLHIQGIGREEWNNMSDTERQHEKDCAS